jgi:hypothetical protein
MNYCIIVPTHINNVRRTNLLITCLKSLINQTKKIPIYLSISFETELDKNLFHKLFENKTLLNDILINVYYQENKMSQFRHIQYICGIINNKYDYVMFCDSDDTYELNRVEIVTLGNELGENNYKNNNINYVGFYERGEQSHCISYCEYTSYCIKLKMLKKFINILINNYENIIDHQFCDVVFSTYLRRLDETYTFSSLPIKLYNYNTSDNYGSITYKINEKNKNNKIIKKSVYDFDVFMKDFNIYLDKETENTYDTMLILVLMGGKNFEECLKYILNENYTYKDNIDKKILKKIEFQYEKIEKMCKILYEKNRYI